MFLLKLGLLEPPTPTVRFLYILVCLLGLSWCLFVCLYSINVKTAEPIGPKFCVWAHVNPGKVYEWSKFKKNCVKQFCKTNLFWKSANFFMKSANKIRFSINFQNPQIFFYKIRELSLFLFYNVHNENMFTI